MGKLALTVPIGEHVRILVRGVVINVYYGGAHTNGDGRMAFEGPAEVQFVRSNLPNGRNPRIPRARRAS